MTMIKNLAGQMVDDDTFVCADCTFEHPLSDLGGVKFTGGNAAHCKVEFLCTRCIEPTSPDRRGTRLAVTLLDSLFHLVTQLKVGEKLYVTK